MLCRWHAATPSNSCLMSPRCTVHQPLPNPQFILFMSLDIAHWTLECQRDVQQSEAELIVYASPFHVFWQLNNATATEVDGFSCIRDTVAYQRVEPVRSGTGFLPYLGRQIAHPRNIRYSLVEIVSQRMPLSHAIPCLMKNLSRKRSNLLEAKMPRLMIIIASDQLLAHQVFKVDKENKVTVLMLGILLVSQRRCPCPMRMAYLIKKRSRKQQAIC